MAKKKFYVTTAIDYTSGEPHIGHGYQKIIADVLARWHSLYGEDVFFLTGTDEHGQKIAKNAKEAGLSEQKYVDILAKKFKEAWDKLDIKYNRFIRTTDKDHEEKVQKFVKLMNKKGDIYKGKYSGLYCVDCEAYVTEKDLVNGKCQFHPAKEPQRLSEEAYFFRLSKYQNELLELYEKNQNYILPGFRRQEVVNRVKEGLKDLNITRANFSWGIPFPLDKKHVIYVWYEALLNYITGIDWPNQKFKKYWPADVHLLGIDNGWFHCVIWPAMLLSAGIKPAKTILINGFLTFNGQKISKSLGNVISPVYLAEKYGADSIRYYVCRNFVFGQDGDFLEQVLVERHNAELADKLGNLISRVSALAEKYGIKKTENKLVKKLKLKEIERKIGNYEIDKALNLIFEFIDSCNEYVQENKIWETGDKKRLYELADSIKAVSVLLWPFIPSASEKIAHQFGFKIGFKEIDKPLRIGKIKKAEILFKKIELFSGESQNAPINGKINKAEKIEGIMTAGTVSFEEWEKLDLRVAEILKVEDIEGADKLYRLEVDVGELGKRTIVAGIKKYYKKEELKGKRIIIITNLEPRSLRGIESRGMLLAAGSKEKDRCVLIEPGKSIESGSRIT
jgi:methionyl-tRNA synthetase